MHDTAMQIGTAFIETYASPARRLILEVGAQDVNGSLRDACPADCIYLGLDIEHGKGVDLKIEPGQPIPLRSEFADLTISTSQMEHDPKFWATFLELCRVTKNGGLIYMSAPSNGGFHSYPIDAWRFYPDAAKALAAFAEENGVRTTLLESFTAPQKDDQWNDYVAIFYRGDWPADEPIAFLADRFDATNVRKFGYDEIQNFRASTEDMVLLERRIAECSALAAKIEELTATVAQLEADKARLVAQLAVAAGPTLLTA